MTCTVARNYTENKDSAPRPSSNTRKLSMEERTDLVWRVLRNFTEVIYGKSNNVQYKKQLLKS
jgi:hypothetical protein